MPYTRCAAWWLSLWNQSSTVLSIWDSRRRVADHATMVDIIPKASRVHALPRLLVRRSPRSGKRRGCSPPKRLLGRLHRGLAEPRSRCLRCLCCWCCCRRRLLTKAPPCRSFRLRAEHGTQPDLHCLAMCLVVCLSLRRRSTHQVERIKSLGLARDCGACGETMRLRCRKSGGTSMPM